MADAPDKTLDASGLTCPLPMLKAKKVLRELPAGAVLEVIATDPGAPEDLETLCRLEGHALLASHGEAGRFTFLIRRRA